MVARPRSCVISDAVVVMRCWCGFLGAGGDHRSATPADWRCWQRCAALRFALPTAKAAEPFTVGSSERPHPAPRRLFKAILKSQGGNNGQNYSDCFVRVVARLRRTSNAGRAPVHQPDGMTTQARMGCGVGRVMVNGVCVSRAATRRAVRRCARWHGGVCVM